VKGRDHEKGGVMVTESGMHTGIVAVDAESDRLVREIAADLGIEAREVLQFAIDQSRELLENERNGILMTPAAMNARWHEFGREVARRKAAG
jgi:hypothetical protein